MCSIYVKDLLVSGVEKGTAELHPRKYSVVRTDKTYCGEIQVGVTFTPKVLLGALFYNKKGRKKLTYTTPAFNVKVPGWMDVLQFDTSKQNAAINVSRKQ